MGLLIGAGVYSSIHLKIDAVPDVTNIQVQINTIAPGLGPVEVEKLVTFPIETTMMGLPDIQEIRSLSKSAFSQVTVVFEDHVDTYFARQLVLERLQTAKESIPKGFGPPMMSPISTGLGEIYQYTVEGGENNLYEQRTIQDWIVRFQLRDVPGVTDINSFGGFKKQYQVLVDPSKLVSYQLPLRKVFEALVANNANAGGAYIEHAYEQYTIRGIGLVQDIEDIENIVVDVSTEGTPIYIKNLAKVVIGPEVRYGAATKDGKGEVVGGIVMMLMGANSREVVNRVKERVKEINENLPEGIVIKPFYDRTDLVNKTIRTVGENIGIGILLVTGIVFLLLGNWKGSLLVALTIPLVAFFTFAAMYKANIPASLMSLGALDFGIVIDGSVVMVENIIRHLSVKTQSPTNVSQIVKEAGGEVAAPVTFAVAIITIVYLPILTLQGIEGKMYRPMALTVCFAMVGALVVAITIMPAVCSLVFFKGIKPSKYEDNIAMRFLKKVYRPSLRWAVDHAIMTIIIAGVIFAGSIALLPFMGSEFMPELDEGCIELEVRRLPSISLAESLNSNKKIEEVLLQFPEVETVVSETGRNEIANDPRGQEMSDVFVMLKPRKEWKTTKRKEELVDRMKDTLDKEILGVTIGLSQPIEATMGELIAGVRSDIGIKIFGEDLSILKEKADRLENIISGIRGAKDVRVEQISGLPVLQIKIDRKAIARYGINVADVQDIIETAIGGKAATQVLEGQMRFDLAVRFPENKRNDVNAIKNILVSAPDGRLVPMSQLAEIEIVEGPAEISRENVHRRIVVECNVRGRDIGSFVKEAQKAVKEKLQLPSGYFIKWGGQFENMQRARLRLAIVVPVSLILIFALLYTAFRSFKNALLIYINVPIAVTGGIFALFLRGMPISISATVGFIALFGLSVFFGVVMVSFINELRSQNIPMREAVLKGAELRLRPVLISSLADIIGFLPMAVNTGVGAEVQRPLATVVIGGLLFSLFLTLFVLPALYKWFPKKVELNSA